MRRGILTAILAALLPAGAWANDCTCASGICTLLSATNWTNCGGVFPAATDSIHVTGGAFQYDQSGTRTYLSIFVESGSMTCTFSGAATIQLTTVIPGNPYGENPIWATGNTGGVFGTITCSGKDLTVSYTGSANGQFRSVFFGQAAFGGFTNDTGDPTVTLRGVSKAKTMLTAYSQGATAPSPDTNMVDCAKGAVADSPNAAVGDTIVFTSGKSQDYWYKISCPVRQCTGLAAPFACCSAASATTECSATACGGGVCDYEITRNATDSTPGSVASSASWSSMTKIASLGGPLRHATPDDSNADGTADGSANLPAVGDSFEVFKPVLIQGGTDPLSNGLMVRFIFVHGDFRYIEINKAGGAPVSGGGCAAATTGGGNFWDPGLDITSPEGDMAFINIHNFMMLGEMNATDRTGDTKANRPRVYRHWYLHDSDDTITTNCAANPSQGCSATPGVPVACCTGLNAGTCTQILGSGSIVTIDNTTTDILDGLTLDGFHFARWHNDAAWRVANVGGPTTSLFRNTLIRNLIVHDAPKSTTYGAVGVSAIGFAAGRQPIVEGFSEWDLGATGKGAQGFSSVPLDPSPDLAPIGAQFRNGFVVNVNTDTDGNGAVNTAVGRLFDDGVRNRDTSALVVSNSYISNVVGSAGYGGAWRFNFIKNANLKSGACTSDRATMLQLPSQVVGNFLTMDAAAGECSQVGVDFLDDLVASAGTSQTRRVVSNVFANLGAATPVAGAFILGVRVKSNVETRNLDVYNNIFDDRGKQALAATGQIGIWGQSINTSKLTAFYNIFRNNTLSGSLAINWPSGNQRDEGYNRFINVSGSPACSTSCASSDVDSDIDDAFVDPANNDYYQRCNSPDKTRNPWGGPVGPLRYGIQSFSWFHPAVINLMSADAFKRFDWRECGRFYQDTIFR